MKFLEQVAQHIYANHTNPGNICIVSPNKRAGVFLRKYLSDKYNKPIFSPKVFGIEDFLIYLSGYTIADRFEQLFLLYQIHQKIEKGNAETIDLFSSWAITLLNDFNEIDQYLVDANKFFSSLNADRALEVWSPGEDELTPFQLQYLKFWEKLPLYYANFKKELIKQNKAYTGMAYRMASENIENDKWKNEKLGSFEKIYFIGFNALTASEDHLINILLKNGNAEIIWDADTYYINDTAHEAGTFLRKNIDKFGNKKSTIFWGDLETEHKLITISGITGNVAQAKYAAGIAAKTNPNEFSNTAFVLSDESLLIPLLESLPENIKSVNITMGYPLKNTNSAAFFKLLTKLHLNQQQFSKTNYNKGFYHKDLLAILKHPFIAKLYFNEKNKIENYLLKKNKVFFRIEDWEKINTETSLPFFLNNIEKPAELITLCLKFIETIKTQIPEDTIENEHLFYFANLFHSLKKLIESYNLIESLKIFQQFFLQFLQAETLPFYGEPLEGVQIMGVLETRTLDFDNIIILSMNEGIFPASKQVNSIIPFALKRGFGMPTYNDKDAIFSFHFYRMLQRSKNIHLIYNSDNLSYSGSEKSRFIAQIEHEVPNKNKNIKIKLNTIEIAINTNSGINAGITNNKHAIDRVFEMFKTGISATHINTYINCKEDFYNKYILQLHEESEVEENIEEHTLGNILHKTLEKLYCPYLNKLITQIDIEYMQKTTDKILQKVIAESFPKEYFASGKNFLAIEICKKYLYNYLSFLKDYFSIKNKNIAINGLEQKLEFEFTPKSYSTPIKFKGTIDKIESDNNSIYIIDYKTGKVENKDVVYENINELFTKKEKSKALQLFFYTWLYHKLHPDLKVIAGIVSIRNPKNGIISLNGGTSIIEEEFSEFEYLLVQFTNELLNPENVYNHNSESTYCNMC